MKIKHWQGYGAINAKKISDVRINDSMSKLTIQLSGNHEYGLVRDDKYDIFNWLLNKGQRFATKIKDYRDILHINITEDILNIAGENIDCALYEITYRT